MRRLKGRCSLQNDGAFSELCSSELRFHVQHLSLYGMTSTESILGLTAALPHLTYLRISVRGEDHADWAFPPQLRELDLDIDGL